MAEVEGSPSYFQLPKEDAAQSQDHASDKIEELAVVCSPTSVLQCSRRESLDSEAGAAAADFPSTSHCCRGGYAGECSPLSLHDLNRHLCEHFPGRETEIKQLLGLVGDPFDYLPPLLVYGSSATGKTRIVRHVFKLLGRPHAYLSIRSCHSPRLLFESILNQLAGHVRSASNNYSSAKRCDRVTEFIDYLADACAKAISRSPVQGNTSVIAQGHQDCDFRRAGREVVYIIIDNLELIREWAGGSCLLSALVRLPELARLPNLGPIFISSLGPDSFYSSTGFRELSPVFFPDYTDDQLSKILLKQSPHHSDLYGAFLRAVLKPFSKTTGRLTDLAQSLEPLFKKYCEPVVKGLVNPDTNAGKRKLCTLVQEHVRSALGQTFPIEEYASHHASSEGRGTSGWRTSTKRKTVQQSDFHLTACSKYLLLAAYIASRNAATLDGALFDSTDAPRGPKKRRCSVVSLEKKDLQIREKHLKGPGSFPLERLLAIFKCVVDHHAADATGSGFVCLDSDNAVSVSITADVLMQLSSLVSANLLVKGCSNPLEGSSRYCCNVDEDFIQEVARSINFPFSKYLLQG